MTVMDVIDVYNVNPTHFLSWRASGMELTVVFKGANKSEELIYSGETSETLCYDPLEGKVNKLYS